MKPTLNNPILYIIIHHTAVSLAQNSDQWQQTNAYHKTLWNFESSLGLYGGYTYEIAGNGKVTQFRAEGEETAAVIGKNRESISICLDGNFDMEYPATWQMISLRSLLEEIIARHQVPISNILPHRSFCGIPPYKTCFGKKLPDNWPILVLLGPEIHIPISQVGIDYVHSYLGSNSDAESE